MKLFLLVVCMLAFPFSAFAQDFEAFSLGSPNGQFGWSSLGSAGSGCAQYDHKISVNGGPSAFGGQSLRISNAVTSGCFGDHTFSASVANEAGESTATSNGLSGGIRANAYEYSMSFSSTTSVYQPGLAVTLSADRGDGARMTWTQIVDTPDGLAVNFYDYDEAVQDFRYTPDIAAGLDRLSVHTLRLTIAFAEGSANDVVKVYVDGNLVHTGTSWEDYFRDWEPGATSRTVDSVLFRTGGAAAPGLMGLGLYFDNMQVKTATVVSNANQCKNNGWRNLVRADLTPFRNQGDCVSYVQNGK